MLLYVYAGGKAEKNKNHYQVVKFFHKGQFQVILNKKAESVKQKEKSFLAIFFAKTQYLHGSPPFTCKQPKVILTLAFEFIRFVIILIKLIFR